MTKREIKLDRKEIEITVDIHKKMMMAIAEAITKHKLGDEKEFHIVTLALSFTITNMLKGFGINNIDSFLQDFSELTKQTFPSVQKNSDAYMVYRKGKKIEEGKLN